MSTRFQKMPWYAAFDRRLGHADHRFLAVLCGCCDADDQCDLANARFAEVLSIGDRRARKSISRLVELGWIERIVRTGMTSVTVVKFDHRPEGLDDRLAAANDHGGER